MSSVTSSQSSPAYCRALSWVTVGTRRLPLLPLRAWGGLVGALLLLAPLLGLTEWLLAGAAQRGEIGSRAWQRDDALINRANQAKIIHRPLTEPWSTAAMPAPALDPARRRILVIGDSFVWGDGVANLNQLWWRQLQWELERRGYWQVDVLALGANGVSTQNQLDWLQRGWLLGNVDPDALIFGYVTNDPDIQDSAGRRLVPQAVAGEDDRAPIFGRLENWLPHTAWLLGEKHAARQVQRRDGVEGAWSYAQWELQLLEGENFVRYQEVVRRLAGLLDGLRGQGKAALFVTTPNHPAVDYFAPRYTPVKKLFDQAGIEFHDLLPGFVERHGGLPPLAFAANPANGHPGPLATRHYAARVADLLEQRHPAVLGGKGPMPADVRPRINDWLPNSMAVYELRPGLWRLRLPAAEQALTMPMRVPHVLLSFERPVRIAGLRLQGEAAAGARLYAATLDPANDHETFPPQALGPVGATALTLDPRQRVSALRVAWEGEAAGRELLLEIDFARPAVRP